MPFRVVQGMSKGALFCCDLMRQSHTLCRTVKQRLYESPSRILRREIKFVCAAGQSSESPPDRIVIARGRNWRNLWRGAGLPTTLRHVTLSFACAHTHEFTPILDLCLIRYF